MKCLHSGRKGRSLRLMMFSVLAATLCFGVTFWGGTKVEANHPILLEGNCDSPVPGTTIVSPAGTCGDFDGDGRIGTAEDTDGADRVFGTLAAALGPGTGAAAGTGANQNGRILIVTSGRFSEGNLIIGAPTGDPTHVGGTGTPGNVTIEAAPGVSANLDAVFQGDPAGLNNTRQAGSGLIIYYVPAVSDRVVTLRNLTIRNYATGVQVLGFSNVHIDNCRFENNLQNGLEVVSYSKAVVTNSQFDGQGRRIGTAATNTPTAGNGNGILVRTAAQLKVGNTTITHSFGSGIAAIESATAQVYKVETYFNNPNLTGPVTIAANPNFAQ